MGSLRRRSKGRLFLGWEARNELPRRRLSWFAAQPLATSAYHGFWLSPGQRVLPLPFKAWTPLVASMRANQALRPGSPEVSSTPVKACVHRPWILDEGSASFLDVASLEPETRRGSPRRAPLGPGLAEVELVVLDARVLERFDRGGAHVGHDRELLAISKQIENADPWHDRWASPYAP